MNRQEFENSKTVPSQSVQETDRIRDKREADKQTKQVDKMRLWSEVKSNHREAWSQYCKVVYQARNREDWRAGAKSSMNENASDSWHTEQLKETSRTVQYA